MILDSKEEWYRFCIDEQSDENGVSDPTPSSSNYDKTVDDFPDRDEFDAYLGAQVVLPSKNGESIVLTKVTNRNRDSDGKLIGEGNTNPILDTRIYEAQYPDGAVSEYSANVIAENILSQVDSDGCGYSFLSEIFGHRSIGEAIT